MSTKAHTFFGQKKTVKIKELTGELPIYRKELSICSILSILWVIGIRQNTFFEKYSCEFYRIIFQETRIYNNWTSTFICLQHTVILFKQCLPKNSLFILSLMQQSLSCTCIVFALVTALDWNFQLSGQDRIIGRRAGWDYSLLHTPIVFRSHLQMQRRLGDGIHVE